jgi:hypothetical protein
MAALCCAVVCGICCSTGLNCLLQYYQVPESVLPMQQQPSLILSAEAELGITAGLQDRVIQVGGAAATGAKSSTGSKNIIPAACAGSSG